MRQKRKVICPICDRKVAVGDVCRCGWEHSDKTSNMYLVKWSITMIVISIGVLYSLHYLADMFMNKINY
jgi:hypothetical protein